MSLQSPRVIDASASVLRWPYSQMPDGVVPSIRLTALLAGPMDHSPVMGLPSKNRVAVSRKVVASKDSEKACHRPWEMLSAVAMPLRGM